MTRKKRFVKKNAAKNIHGEEEENRNERHITKQPQRIQCDTKFEFFEIVRSSKYYGNIEKKWIGCCCAAGKIHADYRNTKSIYRLECRMQIPSVRSLPEHVLCDGERLQHSRPDRFINRETVTFRRDVIHSGFNLDANKTAPLCENNGNTHTISFLHVATSLLPSYTRKNTCYACDPSFCLL